MTSRTQSQKKKASSKDSRRVIAVLGMHRGGTSTLMRSLLCLGVDPGSDLLEGGPSENPLGFFEDEPLLEICDRVMQQLNIRWDSSQLILDPAWKAAKLGGLENEAIESMRARFDEIPVWGFKNPRLARLLPFWQPVFDGAGRQDSYVIALRNPLSVSRSLEARNEISRGTAHLLWLIHMTDAVVNTRGRPRICVDYDELIASPEAQLERIASALDLPGPTDSPEAFERFTRTFLRKDLRTTRFAPADLALEPSLSALAARAYELLRRWASDDDSLSERQLQRGFQEIHRRLRELAPVLAELQSLLGERNDMRDEMSGHRERVDVLQREAVDRDRALALTQQRLEAEEGRGELARTELTRRESEVVSATQALESADQRALVLSDRAKVLEAQITDATEIAARERELAAQSTAAQSALIDALQAEVSASAERLGSAETKLADQRDRQDRARREAAEEHRQALRALDAERASLLEQSAEHEKNAGRAARTVHELSDRLRHSQNKSDQLAATLEAQERDSIDWLHNQTARSAAHFVEAVRVLRDSKAWKITARIQRLADAMRRRKWVDGSTHLEYLVGELHAQAQLRHVDVRFLERTATSAQKVLADILGGLIFRIVRRMIGLRYLLRRNARPAGAVELLRHRVGELAFFLQQLSHSPIKSAAPPPKRPQTALEGCVDVIVPVYEARRETLRCLDSILACENRTPFELIVIDDASHDKKLRRALEALSRMKKITLLRNDVNLGFPATVNRGMALHDNRDVVILNSDTLVHGDWLDRLRRSATGDWNVATVTPFTNNGEICSHPTICQSRAMPDERELARIDDFAAEINAGLTATLPTAVGFCMYIRRQALNAVGEFDAESFLRGYGEENDFCLRARARGYRNLLAADVFVAHEGGSSFSDSKGELIEQGLEELRARYPDYEREVHEFIASDPVRWLRQRLDIASLGSKQTASILMISHAQGGGTSRHVHELSAQLEQEGVPVFLLEPTSPGRVSLMRFDRPALPNLTFNLDEGNGFNRLVEILRLIPIRHLHFHHLLGLNAIIRNLPRELDIRYDVTVHDYFAICPRVHLVDDRDTYCEVPEAKTCTQCIQRNGGETGFDVDVEAWRTDNATLLAGARRVFVPSHDVQLRLETLLPGVQWSVRPHSEEIVEIRNVVAKRRPNQPLRVAVIGAIGLHKGSAILLDCAIDAGERDLPIEFHVVGYTDRDKDLVSTGKVTITGPYAEEDLQAKLKGARSQIAWLPSVWPETYCYTLSSAIRGQLYPVAFDLGAIAERIHALDWGDLLPIGTSAGAINDRLLSLDPPPFPRSSAEKMLTIRYDRCLVDYYDDLEI